MNLKTFFKKIFKKFIFVNHPQFWGIDNYNTLLEVKEKWDPEGLFVCRQCVGSESWDEGGMCRIPPRQRRRT